MGQEVKSTINVERVARFDAFLATLTPEEQREVMRTVECVCEQFRQRGAMFGVGMAKELLMALFEFEASYGRPRRRIH